MYPGFGTHPMCTVEGSVSLDGKTTVGGGPGKGKPWSCGWGYWGQLDTPCAGVWDVGGALWFPAIY